MARTVRDTSLDSRAARARLKHAGKPYYRSIDTKLHLGYRKGKGGGKWVMRWYVGKQEYRVETIGTADDIIDSDGHEVLSFSQAQSKARGLFLERIRQRDGRADTSKPYTVGDCIEQYLAWMEAHRKSASDARYRANAIILPTLGDIVCEKLSSQDVRKWLEAQVKTPARMRTAPGTAQQFRLQSSTAESQRRRRATLNRTLTVLRAALNLAWKEGHIASNSAWARVQPFRDADAARLRYLSIEEAQRLINASDSDFRLLVRAALATGARYGELSALNVEDFKRDSKTLHIRTSKAGEGRHVYLGDEGVELFSELTVGRPPDAPLLPKADGGRWLASHQARPMQAACKKARIKNASFHCLRHTYASHAIMNGAPLMVVGRNLGHADTRMVEKHYGHLAPSFVADAIRAAAPRFGFNSQSNIVQMSR